KERGVGTVHGRQVRLLTNFWNPQAAIVLVEVDRGRARRSERLRHERCEERICSGGHAAPRRAVTKSHLIEVTEELLRHHATESDIADPGRSVAVATLRHISA